MAYAMHYYWIACLLLLGLASNASAAAAKWPSLFDATIDDLSKGLTQGDFSSVDLVKAYIARIHEVNATLHVVTEINPDAVSIAKQLDVDRAKGAIKGPLHGIPILLKDVIATADKMDNTAGSYALLGATVPQDSTIAKKLRAAGAILLGKANLSQWVNARSFFTSNGWSAYGGQCSGAYYPMQDPSGSSSGPAVGISIGLAAASVGTEADGSIVSPSSHNNVVGIKPTVGLTSRFLVLPGRGRTNTIGPIARTVKDAAYMLQAIAGKDPNDNFTSAIPSLPNYPAACKYESLKGKRIGVPRNLIFPEDGDGPILTAFEGAIKRIRDAGAIVVDRLNVTDDAAQESFNGTAFNYVLGPELVAGIDDYLQRLTKNPQHVRNLRNVRDFTRKTPVEEYPKRDTGIFDECLTLDFDINSAEYWSYVLRNRQVGGIEGVLGLLKNHSLDALILPTEFSPDLPARVGTPIVTVPMGAYPKDTSVLMNAFGNLVAQGPNIPFGLSFMGPAWSEAMLIGMAYDYEQRTQIRKTIQPYIKPQTEISKGYGS